MREVYEVQEEIKGALQIPEIKSYETYPDLPSLVGQ